MATNGKKQAKVMVKDRDRELIALRKAGLTYQEIAMGYNITQVGAFLAVKNAAKRIGIRRI